MTIAHDTKNSASEPETSTTELLARARAEFERQNRELEASLGWLESLGDCELGVDGETVEQLTEFDRQPEEVPALLPQKPVGGTAVRC